MSLLVNFQVASSENTGFSAEQYLFNRGFFELGRRTNATAWTTPDAQEVIRISNETRGSYEFFALAQEMRGNPYMPVVLDQKILNSGDHIACVEKLINPSQKTIYSRLKDIRGRLDGFEDVSEEDKDWKTAIERSGIMSKTLSDHFMTRDSYLDVESLPDVAAFKEASIAILELSGRLHTEDRRYVPGPDMNPTNIMWRPTESGLRPVLYDPIIRQDDNGPRELDHTNFVRAKFGLPALDI